MKKLSARLWLTLILIGLVGQFAWTIENMYFNVFLYNTISTDPGLHFGDGRLERCSPRRSPRC